MRVLIAKQLDVNLKGRRKALFPGQVYDLPDDVARSLVAAGTATAERKAEHAFTPKPRGAK